MGTGRLPLKFTRTFNSHGSVAFSPIGAKWRIGIPELLIWENNPVDRVYIGWRQVVAQRHWQSWVTPHSGPSANS